MDAQITDHPYTGQLRRGASCQYTYPAPEGRNPDVCGQRAMDHENVGQPPTGEPDPAVSFKLREQEQRYVYDISGFADLPGVRNPNGPRFRPDAVVVHWYGGDLQVTVEGPRLNADGQPLKRARLLTAYGQEDLENGEAPGWVAGVVLHALGQGAAAVQPPAAATYDVASAEARAGRRGPLDYPPSAAAQDDILNCTHGGDCKVHPGVSGIHNFDPTPADVLDAVMAAVLIRHKFDADDVREIAARYGVELSR